MPDPVAVYGAFTGTVGAAGTLWSIYTWRRDRAALKFDLNQIVTEHPNAPKDEILWSIDIINVGRRAVTVSSAPGLDMGDGRKLVFSGTFGDVPKRLQEGSKVTWWVTQSGLKTGLKKHLGEASQAPTHIVFADDAGRKYRSRIEPKRRADLERLRNT